MALPCADQLRVAFAGRLDDPLPLAFTDARALTPALADGGRLLASSRWRGVIAVVLFTSRPGRLFAEALPVLPARPADKP